MLKGFALGLLGVGLAGSACAQTSLIGWLNAPPAGYWAKLAPAPPAPLFFTGFTPGNLVVSRVGNGSTALAATAFPAFLDEYNTASPGVPVQTISLPTTVSGSNRACTESGTATTENFLTRSYDGRFLTYPGYDAAVGTAGVSSTASSTINRVIAKIGQTGSVDTTTAKSIYSGNSIRSAISIDGSAYWTGGTASVDPNGVLYAPLGAANDATRLSSTVINVRVVNICNGQIYTSAASGTFQGVARVGDGIPTGGGNTTVQLQGFPTSTGPGALDYYFASATVLYVCDDRATASGGGLQKWVYYDPDGAGANPLQWYNVYTLNSGLSSGLRGICGSLNSSGNPTLYCISAASTSTLVTVTDTGNLSLPVVTFTTLATSGANTAFRGVDFAPANTAPTLDNGQVNNLPSTEPGASPTGTTVSNMLGNGLAVSDPDSGALQGIAIKSTTGTGTWQWSQDGGGTWTNIGTAISNSHALLLPTKWQGSDVKVRYLPTSAAELAQIDYRAWDQTCGTPFGTVATGAPVLPNHYGFDCTNNGGVYAVSSAIGTSTIIVDTIPTALPQSLSVDEDGTLPVTLTFSDPDTGQSYTYLISTPPANGSLSGVAPSLTYSPNANYNGSDSFAFRVYDGLLTSTPATISITVNAVNDPPTFSLAGDQTVNEDAGAQSVSNFVSSINPGPANESTQTVTMTVDGNTNTALFSVQPTLSGSGTTRTLNYTPAPDAHGTATITIKAQDDGGTANGGDDDSTQTFTITVNSVNDAPSYTKGADQTVDEDSGAASVTGWATAISAGPADESAQVLTFEVTNNTNPGLFSAGPSVTATGDLSFTPAADANGTATITLRLKDDGGTANGGVDTSATQTFVITVNSVNDVPSFSKGADQTVDEDSGAASVTGWATAISAGPANESSQVVDFLVTNDNNALFSAQPAVSASGDLTFTPAANANGTCTVSVRIHDDGGTANGGVDTSAAQTFTITVNSVNDAPVLDPVGNKSGSTGHLITFQITAQDLDTNQTLTFSLDAGAPAGASMSSGGVFTWTPTAIQDGDFSVTLRVTDNGSPALSDFETITIHVAPTPVYHLTDLGTIANFQSEPAGVNSLGQVVGRDFSLQTGNYHAFLYSNGVMTDLGTLGGTSSEAFGINESGDVVGRATNASGLDHGFLFSAGVMSDLGTFGGNTSFATAINASGQVTGHSQNAAFEEHAFIYQNGVMTDIGTLGGDYSQAFAINDAGQVTGWSELTGHSSTLAFEYGSGGMVSLGSLFGQPSKGVGINASGQIIWNENSPATGNQEHGVLYQNGIATDIGTLGGYPTTARAINSQGVIVGKSRVSGNDRGFVIIGGTMLNLNSLLDGSGAGYTVVDARAIAANGLIAAMSRTPSNAYHAVLLTPINPHAPILDPIGNKTVDELVQLSFAASATDPDPGDSVTFSLGTGAPSGAAITPGGTFTWTPTEARGPGDYPVTVIVSDVANHQDSETIMVHVDEVNVAPTAGDLSPTCNEDGSVAATLSASDPDLPAQSLTYTVLSPPLHGNLSGTAPNLTYTPDADYFGPDSFTYKVNDSFADSNTATASITVSPVNDAPSFTKGADQTVNEDSGAASVTGWATAISAGPANESSQVVDFLVTNDNNALFSAQPAVSSTGDLTFTPAADANGVATVTVKIHDGGGTANGGVDTSAAQTFTITVNSINDEPSFTKGADQTVDEDAAAQSVSGWATAISAGPSDESGQVLTFEVTNDNNSLFSVQPTVSASGALTFTPAADAFGVATVSVTLKDDGGTANGGDDTSTTQTFTITVNSVNDRPSFSDLGDQTCLEDAAAQSVSGWAHTFVFGPANESGQTVDSFIVTNDNNALFSVQPAVSNSGTLTFTPAADANGTATIHVRLKDNGGTANGGDDTSVDHAVIISVTAVNDVPSFTKGADQTVAQDSGAHSVSGWATAISPGPANESSQVVDFIATNDNNALFSAQPAVSASGTLTFTSAAGMSGAATVSVKIHDDGGTANGGVDTSAIQTFTITINATVVSDVTTAFPVDLIGPRRAPAAVPGLAGLAVATTDDRVTRVQERSGGVAAQSGTFGPSNGAINPPQSMHGDMRSSKVLWEVSGELVGNPHRMIPLDGPIGSATQGQALEFGFGHRAYLDDDNDGFWGELSLGASGRYQIRFYTNASTPLATFTAPNADNTQFIVVVETNGAGDSATSARVTLVDGTDAGSSTELGPLALSPFDTINDTGLFTAMVSFEAESHAVATVHQVRTTAGVNRLYVRADVPWVKSSVPISYRVGMANMNQPVRGYFHFLDATGPQNFASGTYTSAPFPNWLVNPITSALDLAANDGGGPPSSANNDLATLILMPSGVGACSLVPRGSPPSPIRYVDVINNGMPAYATASNTVVVEDASPTCAISATEGAANVIPGGAPAKVGTVQFVLDAKDLGPGPGGAGLGAWPVASVTLPDSSVVPMVVSAGEGNKFTCTLPISSSTPCGTATVSVQLVDLAGNSSTTNAQFTINVAQIAVNLQLAGFSGSGTTTRGIRLVFGGNGTGSNTPLVIERNIPFNPSGFASLVLDATDGVPFNKSGFTLAYAKDPKHTKGTRAAMANAGNSQYTANLTLTGGDATGDNLVDVLDFGVFASRYGQNPGANTPLGFVGPHPDFSGNGNIGTSDFTFISSQFLTAGDTEPGNFADGGPTPREEVSVREMWLAGVPLPICQKMDRNRDGKISVKEVQAYWESVR